MNARCLQKSESKLSLEIIITIPAILFGSIVLSAVGFGIGLTSTPFLLLVIDPKVAVVVVNTVSLPVFALLIYQNRGHINYRSLLLPICLGITGVPFGIYIFSMLSPDILIVFIALATIIFGAYIGARPDTAFFSNQLVFGIVSFLVGGFLTVTGIGGPLMALVAVSKKWNKDSIRGSLPLFYLFVEGFAVIGYLWSGMFNKGTVTLVLASLIPALLGFAIASILVRKISEVKYRIVILVIIISSGLMVMAKWTATSL